MPSHPKNPAPKKPAPKDHRELNQVLKIYALDPEIGSGLPLWLPNGAAVREELERFIKELEFQAGYRRVVSPHVAKESLYRKSGHLPYYADGMFPPMELEERESYRLRPMNCPHHHRIFAAEPRSYRDLPLRLAEYGQAYRYEPSGSLSGIIRARAFCQNDAHVYCRRDQAGAELDRVLDLHERAYAALGLKGYRYRLSLGESPGGGGGAGPAKFVDQPADWAWAEDLLREKLRARPHVEHCEARGEAAFYGPKIDVQMDSIAGKEESISSIQIDFSSSARLGLEYVAENGEREEPVILHRAPLGSHERFVAFLMEFYQGAFPLWLAPVQVRVLPIADRHAAGAQALVDRLRQRLIRAEIDERSESLGKRLRAAAVEKVPLVAVMGDREIERGIVAVNERGRSYSLNQAEFVQALQDRVRSRG